MEQAIPATMHAMTIQAYGQKNVEKTTVPTPAIGKDDVLVKILAAGVNSVDFKIRDGRLKLLIDYPMPLILGNDLAGIVAAVGDNVREFAVGDAVYGRADKDRMGTFAEYIAIKKQHLAKKPPHLNFTESASLPLAALTAYQALHERMKLQAGDKVLIHAGAGGVGTAAIQIAKAMGLFVATTASAAGRALVERLGADLIIDYKTEDFSEQLRGYDGVLDTLGGDALRKSFRVVKRGAKVVSVSAVPTAQLADEWGLPFYKKILFALASAPLHLAAKKHGAVYDFLFMRPDGGQLAEIGAWAEQGKVLPVIDKVFAFDDTQQALAYSEQGRAKGKIVIKIADE
ncbi:NADP-dependent oxidoreductase [Conchiformibius kuhniae]|uniref:NADP-dependent oxidoreductase n=1 Tax=Conchiformibius kuhniae TaxID=211502 RepID=A0A8T9MSB9_9NEIS|nr:NADP-dependent oxidoreductase [Conchiformibius kuhniae]UOP04171.1 NADP-dependent oxidoreductase [Conchiformibius kuhniae]